MGAFPVLNFPEYCFRLRSGSGGYEVWDALRGMWLVLTPEEWVRQHLIRFLSERMGAVPQYVSQEYPVSLGGMSQRADIVVCGRDGKPCLLAECKAPDVALEEEGVARNVLAQAVRYNSVVGARYVLLTNGRRHLCFEWDARAGRYAPLGNFPDLSVFFGLE